MELALQTELEFSPLLEPVRIPRHRSSRRHKTGRGKKRWRRSWKKSPMSTKGRRKEKIFV